MSQNYYERNESPDDPLLNRPIYATPDEPDITQEEIDRAYQALSKKTGRTVEDLRLDPNVSGEILLTIRPAQQQLVVF